MSGMLSPRSHLLTALSDKNSRAASSFCVKPFSLRRAATNAPNFSRSISNFPLIRFTFPPLL